jgi:predicted HTH transcriptional regulator
MSLFKNYFDKEKITNIKYNDVVHYFSEPKDENDKIEYKSFVENPKDNQTEREKKILQSICGFLNSDGGLIIWGAPKGKKVPPKKEKIFQRELDMVEYLYEKDAFISKITDSITPAPRGILFHRIDKGDKHIYILEIPHSAHTTG